MINFIPLLKNTDLFKELTSEEINTVLAKDSYEIESYKKNSVVHFPNEKCVTLDIVLSGVTTVHGIDDKGNYVSISDFNIGDVIGGNLLFSHNNFYPMMILSKTDVTILQLKKDLVLKLCRSNANFLLRFLEEISDKTLILTDKIKTLSLKSIRQCVVDFLLYEKCNQKNNVIKLTLTKKQLAEKFGIQRSSLSRELNKMRKEGLIEYDAYSVTIVDGNALKNSK
jgi:CRP-like cAMP-binding protein